MQQLANDHFQRKFREHVLTELIIGNKKHAEYFVCGFRGYTKYQKSFVQPIQYVRLDLWMHN